MFSKWRKYSYADQKSYLSRLRVNVLKVALFVLAYIMLTTVFFPMMVMQSESMKPSIYTGDRFIFYSYALSDILRKLPFSGELPYERGEVVSIDFDRAEKNAFLSAVEKLFRFVTAGRAGIPGREDRVFIKRVIALPGDEISMTNFVMYVKPAGTQYMLTEFELSGNRLYKPDIPQVPPVWTDVLPFSGSMPKRVLGPNECFVLSDDRINTNDSRTWGTVPLYAITGAALIRYWPLRRIGLM